ncbi:MAG: hypothetical protein QOH12_3920 [Solirubrobacteraceae bacterium]|jgi:ABC-type transport system involved in cytochrome c biogenesis ATPase subunit|nr:hypothetical protein [Solirubrobacteraceae bacterium]MEA2373526.1 hypothetical protein [Solirubrobacteraceae bacterium]
MRLASLSCQELFSFERLTLEDIAAGLLTIVGPNGSGKTNLIRLVEVVQAAN